MIKDHCRGLIHWQDCRLPETPSVINNDPGKPKLLDGQDRLSIRFHSQSFKGISYIKRGLLRISSRYQTFQIVALEEFPTSSPP